MHEKSLDQLTLLQEHPELSQLLEQLLTLANAGPSSPDLGDDAEDAVIEVGQAIQSYTLQEWARNKAKIASSAQHIIGNAKRAGKKK